MSIFGRSYRRYEGVLKGRFHRIWAIATNTFRVGLSGKRAIFLLIFCNLPILSFTLFLVFAAIFAPGGFVQIFLTMFGTLDVALYTVISFTFNAGLIFFPLVFICGLNSGAIANDKKYNSLALYLSKPIDRIDYILGKVIGVTFVSSFVTYVPWFIFMVAFTLISGLEGAQFLDTLWVYFAALAAALVIIFFIGSIVLLFSSLTDQSILAGIIAILIIFLPSVISTIIYAVTEASWLNYFSVPSLILSMIYLLFNKPDTEGFGGFGAGIPIDLSINSWAALGILLTIAVLAFGLMFYNLQKEEIH